MADETVIIDIEVSSSEAAANIAAAKEALAELNRARKEGTKTQQEYIEESARLNATIGANTKILKDNIAAEKQKEGSLAQLRSQLKTATKQFDEMSAAERNGAKGQALQQHIQNITAELTKAEEATGRYQRNVGNYKGAVAPVIDLMKNFGGVLGSVGGAAGGAMSAGINKATGAMNVMSKTPVIAVLGVLANILTALIKAFKSSETSANKAAEGLSAFSAVGDGVTRVMQWLSGKLADVTNWLGKLLAKTGLLKSDMEARMAITKEEIALQERRRIVTRENADLELQSARLQEQAADKQRYTAAERLKFLEQANEAEKKIAANEVDLARREYSLIQQRNARTQSNAEDLQREADAYAAVQRAQASYENTLRSLNTRMTKAMNDIRNEAKAAQEAMTDLGQTSQNVLNQLNNTLAATEDWLQRATAITGLKDVNKELSELAKHQQNEATAAKLAGDMQTYYTASIQAARTALNNITIKDGESYEDFVARKLAAQQRLADAERALADAAQATADKEKSAAEATAKAWQDAASAVGNVFGTIADIMGNYTEESRDAVIAEAAMSLAQVYIQQAVAIAKGVAQAMSTPFPANLAAIATVIGAVTSALASTISTVKQAQTSLSQFAVGGMVTGAGTGTSDSIPARLSNGEFVVNAAATRDHLAELVAINGGWGNTTPSARFAKGGLVDAAAVDAAFTTSQLARQLAEVIEGVHPVVSVAEITAVQKRVATKERL